MKTYTQHALSLAFPQMSGSELFGLINDIRDNGQREPAIIFEGQILDGWHRYQACLACGIELKTERLEKDVDPVAWVLSRNLHRRHLSASQRAAAVVSCNEWRNKGNPDFIYSVPGAELDKPPTALEMAREAEVSTRTIEHAKTAQRAGLGEKVRDGEMSVKKAAAIAKGGEPEKPEKKEPPPEMVTIRKAEYDDLRHDLRTALDDLDRLTALIGKDDAAADLLKQIRDLSTKLDIQTRANVALTNECNEAKKAAKKWQSLYTKALKGDRGKGKAICVECRQSPCKCRLPGEEG